MSIEITLECEYAYLHKKNGAKSRPNTCADCLRLP
jgi:hypothetical protein